MSYFSARRGWSSIRGSGYCFTSGPIREIAPWEWTGSWFNMRANDNRDDFFAKVTTYWSYFNLLRPTRGKEWQSPLEILLKQAPAMAELS